MKSRNKREGQYAGKDSIGHVRGVIDWDKGYSKIPSAHTVALITDGREEIPCSGNGCGGKYGRKNYAGSQFFCGGSDRCCP